MDRETYMKKTILVVLLAASQISNAGSLSNALLSTRMSGEGIEVIGNAVGKSNVLRKEANLGNLTRIVEGDGDVLSVYRFNQNGVGRTGTFVQTKSLYNGMVEEVTFKVPITHAEPVGVEVKEFTHAYHDYTHGYIGAETSDLANVSAPYAKTRTDVGLERTFMTPTGMEKVGQTFEVQEIFVASGLSGTNQKLRVQNMEFIKSKSLELIAKRTKIGNDTLIKVFIESPGQSMKYKNKFNIMIPSEEGEVLGYHFNSNASKLTVWTSNREKLEYVIKQDPFSGSFIRSDKPVTRVKLADLSDFAGTLKRIPARQEIKNTARGMDLDLPAGAAASAD
jgi:hypothetical protein